MDCRTLGESINSLFFMNHPAFSSLLAQSLHKFRINQFFLWLLRCSGGPRIINRDGKGRN